MTRYDFHPGDAWEGHPPILAGEPHAIDPLPEQPQRIAGATLPATDETAEAVRARGERHIEMDGGER